MGSYRNDMWERLPKQLQELILKNPTLGTVWEIGVKEDLSKEELLINMILFMTYQNENTQRQYFETIARSVQPSIYKRGES